MRRRCSQFRILFFFLLFTGIVYSLIYLFSTDAVVWVPWPKNKVIRGHVLRNKDHVHVLIMIPSANNNRRLRETVRDTWLPLLHHSNIDVEHVFITGGRPSASEFARVNGPVERDVVNLTEISDDYSSLAEKVLHGLKYVYEHHNFDFLLKVDDDSFVNLPELTRVLYDYHRENMRLYWGYFDGRARVKYQGRWAEPDWYLCDRYLPHALGGGYVLGWELVEFLALNYKLFKLYKNEDVAIGAWLSGLDVSYVHDQRFDTEYKSRGCQNDFLITHKKDVAQLKELHANLVNKGQLCYREFQNFPPYEYNWKVLPSNCCQRNFGPVDLD